MVKQKLVLDIEKEKLEQFLQSVKMKYGYDFSNYKKNTLIRRISIHSITMKVDTFDEYCFKILDSSKNFKEMFKYFSINVTEFFREAENLKILRDEVFPYLSSYAHIKIWDAGCSYGMTSYSLAIMLEEWGLLHKTQIYATDFNLKVLESAKKGCYSLEKLKKAKENYKIYEGERCFENYIERKEGEFVIKPYLKDRVLFFDHNLVLDKCMNEFQLIVCKNVLIYFDEQLKSKVIKLFDDSLCVNGFLNIGKEEYISSLFVENFKEYSSNKKVYQKCK